MFKNRLVVLIKEGVLFQQLVAISQYMVCFGQMVENHSGEDLIFERAEVLVGALAIDELLAGFEHAITNEKISLVGGIVQAIKVFCNGVEMERAVLWLEVEELFDQRWFAFFPFDDEEGVDMIRH